MRNLIKQIPVVFYHSIALKKEPRWVKNFLTIELPFFEDFLKYLKKKKYETVSLEYCINAKRNSGIITKNKICITFDDGYLDNWVFAYPILKKYGFKATVFINPENIDNRSSVRKTLEDCWNGDLQVNELETTGYLTWEEAKLMQDSEVFDFQSHTMTHTKYFVSDELIGFHCPGSQYVYPIWNLFPKSSLNYFTDPEFESKIPFGYPLFKESSSIIAKKVKISEDFIQQAIALYSDNELKKLNYNESYRRLISFRKEYLNNNSIIIETESDEKYKERVLKEISESKLIIERMLSKKVEFCCWPHGENSALVHELALKCGYLATTIGKLKVNPSDPTRIHRFAIGAYKNNRFLSLRRSSYKLHAFEGKQPYYFIQEVYRFFNRIK